MYGGVTTMAFDPGYDIGQIVSNADIVNKFACGNMGGMRRSHKTNTLVLVTDYTKGLYHDKWIGGVLHYTGMGKRGDMDIHWSQNATLAESGSNGVDVHLFEVIDPAQYIYCGRVKLVAQPYTEIQPDEDGNNRLVWMFPVRPVPDNNVAKPKQYVFKDWEDYKERGKNIDVEFIKQQTINKSANRRNIFRDSKKTGLKGKKVRHAVYGMGTITGYNGNIITVKFTGNADVKSLNYQLCMEKKLIEFI